MPRPGAAAQAGEREGGGERAHTLPPHAGGAAALAFVCARRMREGGVGAGGGTKAMRCDSPPDPLTRPRNFPFGSAGASPGPGEG